MDVVATQRAHRSPGCGASQPVAEGWEASEVTQLWLAEAQQQASSYFTHPSSAALLWSHNERARARQRWSRECGKNNRDELQRTWRMQQERKKMRENKSDWCVEILKLWAQERNREPGSHVFIFIPLFIYSFTMIPSVETSFLPGLKESDQVQQRRVAQIGEC